MNERGLKILLVLESIILVSMSNPISAHPQDVPVFSTPRVIPMSYLRNIALSDMNGDARIDIVATVNNSSDANKGLFIFYQDSSGQLENPTVFPLVQFALSMDVGDFNGDSLPDVAFAEQYFGPRILVQNQAGTFTDSVLQVPDQYVRAIRAGDLDGNGLHDIVTASYDFLSGDSSWVSVYRQHAKDVFTLEDRWSIPTFYRGEQDVNLHDVNRDGRLDILVLCGKYRSMVSIFLQGGDGNFRHFQDLAMYSDIVDFEVNDFNDDGRPDVAIPVFLNSPTWLTVFYQDSTGRYPEVPEFYPGLDVPASITSGDLNGDGLLDIVCAHSGWPIISVYLQDGSHRLLDPVAYGWGISVYWARSLALGDINADGRLDVAAASFEAVRYMTSQVGASLRTANSRLGNLGVRRAYDSSTGEKFYLTDEAPRDMPVRDVVGQPIPVFHNARSRGRSN